MIIYVYGDVLLLVALLVTIPLIWSVARSFALRFRFWRAALSGVACAVITYGFIALQISYILLGIFSFIGCFLLNFIAFGKQNWSLLLRAAVMLFLEMLTLCGICTLAMYLFDGNGRAYISLGALIGAVILLCIGIRNKKSALSVAEEAKNISNIRLKMVIQGKEIECDALVDSGNQLLEPVSLCPVVFTSNIAAQTCNPEVKMRVVPYKTASGEGVAMCQKAERAYLFYHGKWVDAGDIYVAYSAKLSCEAIVGYEVFNRTTA